MASSRAILKNLKNINQYLAQFHQSQQSTYFEKLIAEAFSHILHLPFYTSDNDGTDIPHRVIWRGNINSTTSRAPEGGPDAIAYCYGFYLTIEATLKTGANQWTQEFAQSIRHCEDFCSQSQINPKDAFALLICNKMHRDTFRSIKGNPREEYILIPIEISEVSRILDTSILAFTMRHLELRRLLNHIPGCIKSSSSVDDYRRVLGELITNWQKEVLQIEKSAFIGVKSYEAMRKTNRMHVGTSEILQKLQRHQTVNKYLRIIGEKLSVNSIEVCLIQQSLASQLSQTYEGEKVFSPVPFTDFRGRELKLLETVEAING
jgi:hypothetical protein